MIMDMTNLLADFRRLEFGFPKRIFQRTYMDIQHILELLDELQTHLVELTDGAPTPPGSNWRILRKGGRELVLNTKLMKTLCKQSVTDDVIGELLGASRRTVVRRRDQLGISKRNWSGLSEKDLAKVSCIDSQRLYTDKLQSIEQVLAWGSGQEGEKGIISGLTVMGIREPRARIRHVLAGMDRSSHNPPIRRLPLLRRIYRVPWINSLWHINGHHKLIPWKIVIHAGIDGFSRMVTFIRASDNNQATTVLEGFKGGVELYGWPSRVRADYGKENWEVKKLMEEVRGMLILDEIHKISGGIVKS